MAKPSGLLKGPFLEEVKFKKKVRGTTLMVQWLRILLPMQETWIRSLVREPRSHLPQGN